MTATGKSYRAGLPRGTARQVGDTFIHKGRIYRIVAGPQKDMRIRETDTGYTRRLQSWEETYRMTHVAPGVLISAGMERWEVVRVSGDDVSINTAPMDETHPTETMTMQELNRRLQSANDSMDRRVWLCETVELALKDANLLTEDVTIRKDEGGRGLALKGLVADAALPEGLARVATLPDGAVVIGLAPTSPAKQEDKEQDMQQQEPRQRTEIKTLVHALTADGENAFTIPNGWKVEHVTVKAAETAHEGTPGGVMIRRFITISRTVEVSGEGEGAS